MQKKIIALAVAGLVSGAAFAQSNVTVFGIMDIGYQYSWDNYNDKTKDSGKVKAGGHDGSRVGFRGTEDLGNGLKANFEMVANFDGDTGVNGGTLMGEGAYLGLSGASWGEVKAGYIATLLDENTGVDASGRHGVANTGALYGTGKWKNAVGYYSPVFSGLQLKAQYSSNISGQDNVPVQDAGYVGTPLNVAGYSAAASYANGGLKAGVAYAAFQPQSVNTTALTTTGKDNGSEWNAGIAYDFGMVAVSLFGARNDAFIAGTNTSTPDFANDGTIDHRNFIALGLAIPLGTKDVIKLGYGEAKTYKRSGLTFADGKDKDDSSAFGLAYFHNLSKRTNLYAMYGNVDSDHQLYSNGDGYKNAFNVGVRHLF
jgi:predicted porin